MSNATILHASQATGIPVEDILGSSRLQRLCWTRFAIMEAMRARGLSLKQIGRQMHRHHTSILSGLRQAEALRGHPDFDSIRSVIA